MALGGGIMRKSLTKNSLVFALSLWRSTEVTDSVDLVCVNLRKVMTAKR